MRITVRFANTDDNTVSLVLHSTAYGVDQMDKKLTFGPVDIYLLTPQFLADEIADLVRKPFRPKLRLVQGA